jgi:subtilisin family serine protease
VSRRKRIYSLAAVGLLFAMILGTLAVLRPFTSHAATPRGDNLSKHDRELIATALVNGQKTVTFIIASRTGANRTVASGVANLGGKVNYRDDTLDYLRVTIATSKAIQVGSLSGVQAANVDEVIPIEDPRPEAGGSAGSSTDAVPTPPGPGTPAENPQMPTRDIGAPQFVAAHPTYDGRGVVIGILDTGVDLLTPELQTATDLNGNSVRKIIDWRTGTDPLSDNDPTWINMSNQVTVSGGSFTSGGTSYSGVAADGVYRFGVFHEAGLGGEYNIGCGADVNRNGVCNENFAVLWRTSDNMVWVDANADASFAGEAAMTDYSAHFDMGAFGTGAIDGDGVRHSVPFVVQTDGKDKYVNIGIVAGEHGTHVAGIAAGKHFFGGAMNGAAPEAQIVSVRACMFASGCTAHALIEGMIFLEKQANVDVINMSIGGLPALNDGNNSRALIYNRLIGQSKAQMVLSMGNDGPGINTAGDPGVASDVIGVGAYVHKDTWFNDYGAVASKTDGLFVFSSRGPREDGGFKPDVVAPGAAISTIPRWEHNAPLVGPLPQGYDLLNGTSMAAPQVTGGTALLISAAKQAGAQYNPEQLRAAIKSSARYLPAYGADEQGNGLFQVGAAWDLLKTNIQTTDITSSAPVNTIISGFLATPNTGLGIYEREGWKAGDSATRTITFTRTSGGGGSVAYTLDWVGNDGTFSSAGSISLPLNSPVSLAVTVHPTTDGVHSAILNLRAAGANTIAYQTMNTVVAAAQFNAGNNFTVSYLNGSADKPDKTSYFFSVPANTPAFKVDVKGPSGSGNVNGRVRLLRFHPYGISIDNTSTTPYQTGLTQTRTLSNPQAGVWEITIDTSRTSTVAPATFSVTATLQGVDIVPASWTVDPATAGSTYTQAFTFTNRFGTFTGGAVGTDLGSAFSAHPTIAAAGPQQTFQIDVPLGSTSVSARIGNASDNSADLDLYLFDCHTGSCALKSSSTSGSANEFTSFTNPAAGTWIALVDPFAVPAGSTTYDYIDVIANPSFGTVTISDPVASHANGTSWTATASVTPNAAPSSGRFLQGFVQVKSGSAVLGSAEVDLKF